ncbi:aminopeptidase C [Ligilactobacillus ceti]|uniref:Aminopeptidase n=1 Tax=Ligilactobacillus ceti DSM 22408 TaxID=1122146 RepID=A0A0R2KIY1_9LACO|nr:C1 family peptidase [Ligilactobacillus ceti]KRN89359.1 aminopeptidase [Ligilactobacillus ceti DSM 22408]
MTNLIDPQKLAYYREQYTTYPAANPLARATQKNGVIEASENHDAKRKLNRTYSVEIETGDVTYQQKSGRCWIFATLNTLRHDFAKKYKVKNFQFSQNYVSFYDRLEKSNQFYNNIIKTADRPLKDRYVQDILHWGNNDGGQWANAAALIPKYGLVPQDVMPETFNSNNTEGLNATLNLKLKKDALVLRELVEKYGIDAQEVAAKKDEMMTEIYRMLVFAFGQPPVKFDFEYRDDDKNYHIDQDLTPKEFYDKYVGVDLKDYVCLTDAPDHELGKVYGLPSQDYIPEGQKNRFLISTTQALKDATVAQLKAGETVWFACDVAKDMDRKQGILASEYFKQDELFGLDLEFSKKDRLLTGEAEVSHAMTFTGVDEINGQTTKWKVENSWSDKIGEKGYFIMSDEWFDKYMYEVIINKKYLSAEQVQLWETATAIELEPWDSLR